MSKPLMPKATAVWLVDNTSLTFEQIADFCGLHPLEVKGIADGEVAQGIQGLDPVATGQITKDNLDRSVADPNVMLVMEKPPVELPPTRGRGGRYTPLSKRQDRPNAIAWLLRNHPELTDAQVGKLVGTTKPTIQSIRDRSHWNMPNIKPQDPVTLGLTTQVDLDAAVQKAQEKLRRQQLKEEKAAAKAKAEQFAAAEAAGMPSTQPVPEPEAEAAEEAAIEPAPATDPLLEDAPAPEPKPEERELSAEDVFGATPPEESGDDERP